MLEILSRMQFAFTIMFHFLFVPLSIGLILLVAIFETMHYKKKDDLYRKLGDYFGNIFVVLYAVGIVTGITMSIQFGTNWAKYAVFMGDVFGAPLALEALIAFFLESTFTGVWIFVRHQISPKFRMITAWLVWFGTSISSLWIITANGFMQNPVEGAYEIVGTGSDAHIVLLDIWALIFNPYAWYMLIHTVFSAYLLGAAVVVSILVTKLIKKDISDRERLIYKKALKIASITSLIGAVIVPMIGNSYYSLVSSVQPTKVDAIKASSAELSEFMNNLVSTSFILMVSFGTLMIFISLFLVVYPDKVIKNDTLKKLLKYFYILPYIAINAGWVVAECGRQPWVVYGLLKTEDAVSEVPIGQVVFSLVSIVFLYAVVGIISVYFVKKLIAKNIDDSEYVYPGKFLDSSIVEEESDV